MGQNTSTVLPRQAKRELKRKKCQILLTFNQGHYCHKGSTSLNVSDTAIVQALQLDIHTAKCLQVLLGLGKSVMEKNLSFEFGANLSQHS